MQLIYFESMDRLDMFLRKTKWKREMRLLLFWDYQRLLFYVDVLQLKMVYSLFLALL